MDFSGAGTAIMLALAAVLWFLYLLPSWIRRREFLATERNATRLQRAIRVMAETAEAPVELRVEATARDVARTERLLEQERRRAEALERAEMRAAELRARAAEAQAAELGRAARAARRAAPAAPSAPSTAGR
ncbi:MAG: large exoprotein, partial [Microbacteriaceae bacterium]